jgi:hypothetical protein
MRFDEAFDILVDHCAQVAPSLLAAKGHGANSARQSTYGNDIWIAQLVQNYWAARGLGYGSLTPQHYVPFYDAAWELSRIGVLRPGSHAPMGQGQIGNAVFSGDGYSITEFGAAWLADPNRRVSGDASRLSEVFDAFAPKYGPGFSQRANEAIRCHRTGNYLAANGGCRRRVNLARHRNRQDQGRTEGFEGLRQRWWPRPGHKNGRGRCWDFHRANV